MKRHTRLFFSLAAVAFAAGCSTGGGAVPKGPAISDFSRANPVPTLAAGFAVSARDKVGGVSSGGEEIMSFSVNHASEVLLDELIPAMAERGFQIEIDADRAKKMNKFHPNRSEFVDPRTSRNLFQEVPVFGSGLDAYVGAIQTDRPREAYMSVRGGCGGENLRREASCTLNVMVLDRNVNEIYRADARGTAGGESHPRYNIEAAWKAALANLPLR